MQDSMLDAGGGMLLKTLSSLKSVCVDSVDLGRSSFLLRFEEESWFEEAWKLWASKGIREEVDTTGTSRRTVESLDLDMCESCRICVGGREMMRRRQLAHGSGAIATPILPDVNKIHNVLLAVRSFDDASRGLK